MDIKALQMTLREFAAARNWQPFHTPKNLTAALMVESAELVEIFQWMTADESLAAHLYPEKKERIADEVADVLLYLLQVADRCAIDIPQAVANKLVKNAIKHPVPVSMLAPVPKTAIAITPVEVPKQAPAVKTAAVIKQTPAVKKPAAAKKVTASKVTPAAHKAANAVAKPAVPVAVKTPAAQKKTKSAIT